MQDMKEDIKNTINSNINEKFKCLETKNELLEQKLETQTIKINNLERTIRKKNLLIFGVSEDEKSYWDLEEKVIDIINNVINIKCDSNGIECVRRLGKKGEKVRPIVITLTTMGLKIKIQKNKKKLIPTPYYIKEDFPPEILSKRKELQMEVSKEREQGKLAIIKYDKIVILKNRNQQAEKQIMDKKKRVLSESPETSQSDCENNKDKQPIKNKTNSMDNFLLKKPTLQFPSKKFTSHPHDPRTTQ
ncbi:unnamed protein product [Parnassius apollo]|uniref:(apollo) hypothetical protein n=1 Tax=Parnassius apollo TaxID=110799 RepID=A0A8S3XGX8_PARAO|nr:unnamed protein product [Parnassius apollo]